MLTLGGLRDYMRDRHHASIADMAVHFDAAPDAVKGALAQWTAKGRMRRLGEGESCSRSASCSCACKPDDVYEWVDP
jgi:putative ferrous iron transport protein C